MPTFATTSNAIVHEFLDDEVIIANLETGCYFSLRGAGIPIWQLLIAGVDSTSLLSRLASHYDPLPDECESHIHAFLNTVTSDGLLAPMAALGGVATEPCEDNNISVNADIHFPKEYSAPVIEKYDEMTDLLMLDPVHEVDTQGWPKRPPSD
jgi:hypothetical protein